MSKVFFKSVLFSSLAIGVFSCKKAPKEDTSTNSEKIMSIDLTVDGLRKGTVYICTEENSDYKVLDSIVFDNTSQEQQHINIPMEEPDMMYLFVKRDFSNRYNNNLRFFGEPSAIKIKTSNNNFYNATIEGSENEKTFKEYLDKISYLTDEYNRIVGTIISAENKNNQSQVDLYQKKLAEIKFKKAIKTIHFAWQNPDKEASAYITYKYMGDFLPKYADTVYQRLNPQVQQSKYGQLIFDTYIKGKK